MQGRYCRLEPLSAARHAADLFDAFSQAPDASDWTYMSVGPFADAQAYLRFAEAAQASDDPLHHAVIDLATGRAIGSLALMRVDTASGWWKWALSATRACSSARVRPPRRSSC